MEKTQTKKAKISRGIKLAQSKTNRNYWSLLTCLVEEQEKLMEETARPIKKTSSKSEREIQIFLKQNGMTKKKH